MNKDFNLGDSISSNSIVFNDEFINELKEYNNKSKINYLNKEDYRNRINMLYDSVGKLRPIDNEVNNVIYFDDYEEVGLAINKKDVFLRQIWTEYRLVYNERVKKGENVLDNSFVLDNFDELYDKISKKVDGVDKYIYDLNSLKNEINTSNINLKSNKENFELEKVKFENYRREEIARLEKKEKELNDKLDKINNLLAIFDEKLNGLIVE